MQCLTALLLAWSSPVADNDFRGAALKKSRTSRAERHVCRVLFSRPAWKKNFIMISHFNRNPRYSCELKNEFIENFIKNSHFKRNSNRI